MKFSYYKAPITNKTPYREITLDEVYKVISGDYLKSVTDKVRGASRVEYKIRNDSETMTSEFKELKKNLLPYATFAGTFTKRQTANIKALSGLMCFDFDHIENPETLKDIFSNEESIQLIFTSPGGEGLKVVLTDPMVQDTYEDQYKELAQYFLAKYNLIADKTSDISRACFLCHDPKAWLRSKQPYFETLKDGRVIQMHPAGYPLDWAV